jgi:1,4-alpha-glucan branching enzyme
VGTAINFDDDAAPVREFVTANAAYWIESSTSMGFA